MIPGTAMYTIGFAGLADSENRVLYISIAVLLSVIVFGTAAWLRKRYIAEEPSDTHSQEKEN